MAHKGMRRADDVVSRARLILCAALAAIVGALGGLSAARADAPPLFSNGFETDTAGWHVFEQYGASQYVPTRVPSGTNGITSKSGAFHAQAPGPFDLDIAGGSAATNWGGYGLSFPPGGYTTQVDIYLDVATSAPNDTRFDFSSAISQPGPGTCNVGHCSITTSQACWDTGSGDNCPGSETCNRDACTQDADCFAATFQFCKPPFQRDFVFNGGFYNDSLPPGSGPRFVIAAGNNAGRGSSYPKDPGHDPIVITTSGWYTFRHRFYDNGSGVLAVDLSIIDSTNTVITPTGGAWTRSDPSDVIGSTVGGNRYGWFAANEFPFLAIDNGRRAFGCGTRSVATTGSDVGNDCIDPGSPCQTIQRAIDVACTGETVNVASGTYTENVVVTKPVTLAGAGQGVSGSIVQPAVSNPNCGGGGGGSLCSGASNIILVQADNVSIHGFTVDGDNPALTSNIVFDTADLDARNGIITNHQVGTFNNLEVDHVTVQNVYLRGMYASSGGTFNFHDNTVHNVQADPSSVAMFNFGGSGTMASNTVSDANDAISANHSSGTQFLNNTVTNSGSGVHTDNAGDGGGIADILQGNQVSNCTPNGFGVWVFVDYLAPIVQQNTVTNCSVGLALFGQGFSLSQPVTPEFRGNSVDGINATGSIGAVVTTDLTPYGSQDASALFDLNILNNNETGLSLQPQSGFNATVTASHNTITGNSQKGVDAGNGTATLTCNLIASNGTGIAAATAAVGAQQNSIVDNTVGADGSAITAGSMSAVNDWWGCVAGPGNPGCDGVIGSVNFLPVETSAPACVSCTANADCSDGVACNGVETCSMSGTCQAGTAPTCPLSTVQCFANLCTEPLGTCSSTQQPDGTPCNSGDDCESGVCTGPNSLTLSLARLKINTAKLTSTHPNGSVLVYAHVNDNSTGGALKANLVAGTVTLEVTDVGSSFQTTIPLTGCHQFTNGTVRCRSTSGAVTALFGRVAGPRPLPNVYAMRVMQTKLTTAQTGSTRPNGPVKFILHQTTVVRPTMVAAANCKPTTKLTETCRGS